jgi:bacterioferritin-associated ferredoxin
MYVCICKAVTEKDIAAAVDRGVRTMRQLRLATQCSSQCGRCAEFAKTTLTAAVESQGPANPQIFNVALTAV